MPGYVTPKVAVGAVVGNDAGEILLVQRADSGIWLYPTGWADIGYSPAEVAVKEVAEETGIECEPVQLLAVLDGLRMGFTRFRCTRWCSTAGPSAASWRPTRSRPAASGWFGPDDLPRPTGGALVGSDGLRRHPGRAECRPTFDPPARRRLAGRSAP